MFNLCFALILSLRERREVSCIGEAAEQLDWDLVARIRRACPIQDVLRSAHTGQVSRRARSDQYTDGIRVNKLTCRVESLSCCWTDKN